MLHQDYGYGFGAIDLHEKFRPGDDWDEWCKSAAEVYERVTGDTAKANEYYNKCVCNAGGKNLIPAMKFIVDGVKALVSGEEMEKMPELSPPCTAYPGQDLSAPWTIIGHIQRGLWDAPEFTSNEKLTRQGKAANYLRWIEEEGQIVKDIFAKLGIDITGVAGQAQPASPPAGQSDQPPAGQGTDTGGTGRKYTGPGVQVDPAKTARLQKRYGGSTAAKTDNTMLYLALGVGAFLMLRGATK